MLKGNATSGKANKSKENMKDSVEGKNREQDKYFEHGKKNIVKSEEQTRTVNTIKGRRTLEITIHRQVRQVKKRGEISTSKGTTRKGKGK